MPKNETVLEVLIKAREEVTASLNRIQGALSGAQKKGQEFGQSLILQVSAANLLANAVTNLGREAVQQFKKMVLASEEFRLRTIGIAAQLTNLAAAGQGDYGQIFQRNLLFADRFYNALRRYDAEHASSLEEMLTLYDAFVQKGYQVRLEEAKALAELTDRIKLATTGQNFQIQAYQEIKAILEGTADVHSQIARELRERLGPSWQQLIQQHREAGTLVKFIASQYPGITAAAKEFERTLEAQTTSLSSQVKHLGREGLGGLYELLVDSLAEVNKYLREHEVGIRNLLLIISSMVTLALKLGDAIALGVLKPIDWAIKGLEKIDELRRRLPERDETAWEVGMPEPQARGPYTPFAEIERIAKARQELLRLTAQQTEGALRPASEKAVETQKELLKGLREIYLTAVQGPGADLIRWYEGLTDRIGELLEKLRQIPELQKDIVHWEQLLLQARQQALEAQEKQIQLEYERWRAGKLPGIAGRQLQIELEYRQLQERYGYRLQPYSGLGAGPAAAAIPPQLRPEFERLSRQYGIPLEILAGVARAESGFRQEVTSPKGAMGIMQLMPETAKEMGVNPQDLLQNLEGGAKYLARMFTLFGDWTKAVAAYNWGPQNLARYGMERLPEETRKYLTSVFGPGGAAGVQGYQIVPDLARQQEIQQLKLLELDKLRAQAAAEYSGQLKAQLEGLLSVTRNFEDEIALRQQILAVEQNLQRLRLEQFISEQGLTGQEAEQLRNLLKQQQAVDQIGRLLQQRRQEAVAEAAGIYRERMEMSWLPLQEREAAAEQYRRLREVQISYELEEMRRKYGQLMDEAVLRAYEATQREMVERQIGGALGAIALEWEAAWKRAAENVQDALANLLYNLMTQTRNARDILRSLVSSMLQILSQLAASAIIRGAGSLLGSAFGGLGLFSGLAGLFGGGGSTGFALGGAAQYTTGVSGLIPMLQHGGIVTKPTLAVVGEAGPEAVIPLSKMEPKKPEVEVQVVNVYDPAQIRQMALAALSSPEGRTIILNTLQLDASTGGMVRTFRR